MKGVPVADWRFTRRDDGFSSRKKKPTVSLAGQTAGFCTDYEMNFIKFTLGSLLSYEMILKFVHDSHIKRT